MKRKSALLWTVALLTASIVAWRTLHLERLVGAFLKYAESLPPLQSAIVHVIAGVVLTPLLVPTLPVNFSAGALLGIGVGTLVTVAGCTVGAGICFICARYLAKSWAQRQLDSSPNLRALDRAVRKNSLQVVALARLSPVFPFPHLSYALGVTSVSFWEYMLGTAAGMAPGVAAFCYLGKEMKDVASGHVRWWKDPTLFLSVAGTLLSVVLISWWTKRALSEHDDEDVA